MLSYSGKENLQMLEYFEKKKGRKRNVREYIKSQQPVQDNIITV